MYSHNSRLKCIPLKAVFLTTHDCIPHDSRLKCIPLNDLNVLNDLNAVFLTIHDCILTVHDCIPNTYFPKALILVLNIFTAIANSITPKNLRTANIPPCPKNFSIIVRDFKVA